MVNMSSPLTRDDAAHLLHGFVALLVVSALGVGALFALDLDDWIFAKRFSTVEEGLVYRSGQMSPIRFEGVVNAHHIEKIVRFTTDDPLDDWQLAERDVANRDHIAVEVYALEGNGTGDPEMYVDALSSVWESQQAGEAVLMHCAAGSERTGVASLLWQVLVLDDTVDEAMVDLLDHDHRPHRNPELLAYVHKYLPRISTELAARGVPVRKVGPAELARLTDD